MKKSVLGFGMLALLIVPVAVHSQPQVEWSPISIAALQEFGILKSGHYGSDPAFHDEWVDHFGAFVTQSAKVSDRLDFEIGLGGIFQFQSPQFIKHDWGGSQYKSFFIGPTTADLRYKFGNISDPVASVQFGMFPFKYSTSTNLGEYLFRTGPYPTVILTGGYAMVNSASAYLQGLKINLAPVKNLSLDFFLTTETNIPPLYDFTATGLAKYTIFDGLFEFGAGVQFKRLISVDGDKTSSKAPTNSYFVKDGKTYVGNTNYYSTQKDFLNKQMQKALAVGDTAKALLLEVERAAFDTTEKRVRMWTNPLASTPQPDYSYYTTAGTTLMGRVCIDTKKAFQSDVFGESDLKLYAETAVLGLKNYPIYYERRTDRMPWMIGFNLPTFKFLDLVSLEYEVFNSPWINSFLPLGTSNDAIPQFSSGNDDWNSDKAYNDISTKDNTSWSLLIQKKIAHSITISGQMARDHARMVSLYNWFGPGVDPNEVLSTSKDWYWMLQFSFGI